MVSLFIGLCEAAGLVGEPRKRPAPKTRQAPLQPREKRPTVTGRSDTEQQKPPQFSAPGALPPALAGLIASLPQNGGTWSKGERDRFVHTFSAVLDFCFPVTSGKQARATEDLDE